MAAQFVPHAVDEGLTQVGAVAAGTTARYEAGLAALTADERDAVISRVEFGLNYAEVAEAPGKPTADAARMYVARAIVKLARLMEHDR